MAESEALSRDCVDTLYQSNRFGWIGLILLWFGMSLVYWDFLNPVSLLLSSLLMIGVSGHIFNQYYYAQRIKSPVNYPAEFWMRTATLLSAFNALVLGVSPLFLLDTDNLAKVYLITAIIVSTLFGSSVISGSVKSVHIAWTFLFSEPLTMLLIFSGDREQLIMGLMLQFAGIPTALLLNVYIHRVFITTLKLRHENDDLLVDLNRQKKLAEQASLDKSRFLAAASHDLRQPMHAMDLYLESLQLAMNEPTHLKLLEKIKKSSASLAELLNASLDISKMDTGGIEVFSRHFNLAQLCRSVAGEFEDLARRQNIRIELQLIDVVANTDQLLLGRMIRNLLSNAIKHNRDCELRMTIELGQDEVTLSIRDTGTGIAKSELENIFAEFYQLDNPNRDRSKGIGLGLAIVRRLAAILGIPVEANSEPGKGSCFSLRIAVDDSDISLLDIDDIAREDKLPGIFVLVIDDDAMIRDATRSLLRSWDCEVLASDSASALLQELKAENYPLADLIISDYGLANRLTGFDAISSVRQYFKTDIPAIILTGNSSVGVTNSDMPKNCQVMLKPVGSKLLRSQINQLLA